MKRKTQFPTAFFGINYSVLTILVGVFGFFFLAILIQHGFRPDSSKAFQGEAWDPQLVLKKSVLVGWDHGERRWELEGDQLIVDHRGHFLTYFGNGLGKAFYRNKPFLSIRAPRIRLDLDSKYVQILDGVKLYAEPKTVLIAEQLYWNQFAQKLYVPGEVYVRGPQGSFHGKHFLLSVYEGKVQVSGVSMQGLLQEGFASGEK